MMNRKDAIESAINKISLKMGWDVPPDGDTIEVIEIVFDAGMNFQRKSASAATQGMVGRMVDPDLDPPPETI